MAPFLARMSDRKVVQWGIAYLGSAWLLLQFLDLLAGVFAWPPVVLRITTAVLACGLAAALILAWYHGEHGAQRLSGAELVMLGGILVVAGSAVAFVSGVQRGPAAVADDSAADSASSPARLAIAVLPFQNLSAGDAVSYFAGGLHDELLTQLSKVAALSVRARTSVMAYAGTTRTIPEIGRELAVGTIVEGSVQVAGDRLRVNVQLIDAATDEHLWAEHYDRSLDDAFAVQSEIAQRVVASVGATLAGDELAALTEAPTSSPEAYRMLLRAREYLSRGGWNRSDFLGAQSLLERAIALDPSFALAHAELSMLHGGMHWMRVDPDPRRLVWQEREAREALRLAPDLPRAHLAMGSLYYNGRREWKAALREYTIALERAPGDADVWARVGYVHRRLGNWEEAIEAFEKAVALDPRNVNLLWDLGGDTHVIVRRYQRAIELYDRASALAPEVAIPEGKRAFTWVAWQGSLDSMRAARARQPALGGLSLLSMLAWERRPDTLLALIRGSEGRVLEAQMSYEPLALHAAVAYRLKGEQRAARLACDSALLLLDSAVAAQPDDWRIHMSRGLALACAGRARDAEAEAEWLRRSPIYRDDAYWYNSIAGARISILALLGHADAVVAELETLLSQPSFVSPYTIRLDPALDPVRAAPAFKALLARHPPPGG